ncbi:Type 2A phosphatase-associated protein 42 [Elasticomyces elasticus]|nr:Type 2A phosphatase-associated protein 42 [Elasticomyces elasticus]
MADSEASIRDLFDQVKDAQLFLDELSPMSDDFRTLFSACIASLKQCQDLVDRLALFSSNEELDDLSTPSIQYLSIDYLLSELLMRSYSPSDRKGQLLEASGYLESYLTRLGEYRLLSSEDTKLLSRYRDERQTFSLTGDTIFEAKRNLKVARYREEKQLKSQLATLRQQSDRNLNLNVDEETIRKLYLAELSLYTHNAFQSLDQINQERQILASIPIQPVPHSSAPPEDSRQTTRNGDGYSERLDRPGLRNGNSSAPHRGILDSKGRPTQPFTITTEAAKREQLRRGVFRPDHSLPTMSIDEYLEEERKRGGIIDGGGANQAPIEPEIDEDNIGAQDEATYRAREWDEFVEANPKGAGNTLNRG